MAQVLTERRMMDEIGMSPDFGKPKWMDEWVECPECGSTNVTEPDRFNACECLDCGEEFQVAPDPFEYMED